MGNDYGQRIVPGSDNLSALTVQEGVYKEPFQSSVTSYTHYYNGSSLNDVHLTATLADTNHSALYVNNERITSGSAATVSVAGATSDIDVPVRVEPYFKPGKTYTVKLVDDSTAPVVQFGTNGRAAASTSAASVVTVSDTQSGIDPASLKYVWTQSMAVPVSGWADFNDGDTLTHASGDGNWYLHIRATDKVGNVVDRVSNPFVLDNTAPTVTVSSSEGSTVNAPFSVTFTFNEAIVGFTENDVIIENGTMSDLANVTAATYTATLTPTTSGQAVKITVAAGAVMDAAGIANLQSYPLQVQYDTTKPVAAFGNFVHGQPFNIPPAAVTISVGEAVYWIAGGAELDAWNALPLIYMVKDGISFTDYTANFNPLEHKFTLTFNSTLQDGVYEVGVAGGVVRNVYQNTLDAVQASFTIDTQPPVITLVGNASIELTEGDAFVDPGATVADSFEEGLSFTVTGSVNNQVSGTYILQYTAQDSAGNAAVTVTRTVRVNERSTDSSGVQKSSNANLNRLTVKANGDELKLSPIFTEDTTNYQVTTLAGEVSVEAVLADAKASVSLGEAAIVGGKTVTLTEGDNVFELIVKAENGAVKHYTLTIHRQKGVVTFPDEGSACTFLDIKGHWAERQICEATDKGIVEGYSATEFAPQGLVTRVEFAAMLLRTLGIAAEPAENKLVFTDRDQIPAWATSMVSDAVKTDILQGYPDGSLRPMQTVSRSEMAAMLARAMKWEIEQGAMTSFADDADISNWAKGYIHAAAQRGLLNGRDGNQFSPSQSATRAEAAATLLRLWHVLNDMPGKSKN